ncbi:glycosyltransferase family 4 protein [Tenacibaculum jejuense]|uniref:Glycosyl transferase, group 4 family protein n=1 Tax=Tenacibaculum jejuense TaxID=584609 RepID=A0A238UAR7_9FLAO|nr:glycosyltransferase family 1 protein [Tenacibaculum jejuense]SNR15668.1 Glycosyl transferase, group 4 family protein [Tenacibaculum jejuense]
MRIGFDAKRAFHNTTGLGNYSRDLIRILSEYFSGEEYYLYNTKPKKVDRLDMTKFTERLPEGKFWKKFSSIWRQGAIVNQIKKDNIDLYHGLSGEIPRNLKSKGIKSVVTIHDLIFVRYPKLYSFFDRKIHFNKFKYAAHNADRVIAISEQTKKDIVSFLKVDSSKIDVIYQGCHAVFKQQVSQEQIKQVKEKYNLPDQFIFNVGTIEERKNLLSIVKAIKDIDIVLVVAGRKTNYFDTVQEYIVEHKLENKILFLGGVDLQELATIYQIAKIFIYPSIFEGFGIPIIEALYSKTPVITSKGGVFPEAGGPNSIYVEPYNINELQQEINTLLNNDEKRKEIAEKGYTFVQKFNDEAIANSIMNLYKQIV